MSAEKRAYSFAISVMMSLVVWVIINLYLIEIKLITYIIIEISIGIGEIFTTFVKEKLGLTQKDNRNN